MHTLGSTFIPPAIHTGGLRYHGMSPLVSHVLRLGLTDAIAVHQTECFAAGIQFAASEGILPAPEANHAVAGAIREAMRCREEGVSRAILLNLCGHGHFDMSAYTAYLAGNLMDYEYPEQEIAMALAGLPSVAGQ
jgi:tryptophan synthase beta chain